MHNRIGLLLLSWLMGICPVIAQEKGFLFTYSDTSHSWFARDALETESGDFIIGARDRWGNESRLLKISPEGTILAELPIHAKDTTVMLLRLLYLPNEHYGDIIALCPCEPLDNSQVALLFLHFDDNLNVLSRKTVQCPFMEQGDFFIDGKALASGSSIFSTFTITHGTIPFGPTFLSKIDEEYNFVSYRRLDSISSVCNLFQAEDDKIGLFGKLGPSYMGLLTFNDTLHLISRDSLFQWSAPEGGNGDFCHYNIDDIINSQASMLPDGSHFVSARLLESMHHANGYPFKNDRSAILAKYKDGFHQPESHIVAEHINDSIEFPAFFRSMDFKKTRENECAVFQCVNLNEFPSFGLIQPSPTGFVVTKTDQDLNLIWKKRYLMDKTYQAMTVNATYDGGCLVVGSVGDYQAQRFDVFALKINADGTVGLDEIQEESIAFVYPNPAKETIRMGGVEARESQVYNTSGRCVMTFRGNKASVRALPAGVYLLVVTDSNGKTQTLRFVKTNSH